VPVKTLRSGDDRCSPRATWCGAYAQLLGVETSSRWTGGEQPRTSRPAPKCRPACSTAAGPVRVEALSDYRGSGLAQLLAQDPTDRAHVAACFGTR
jgi:hypothetical protein